MIENYEKAEAFTLNLEGKSPVAKDIGDGAGLTKYGIAQKWHHDVDVASLTLDKAKEIYRQQYWIPAGCDGLPYPLDCITFDTAINEGPGTAKVMARGADGNAQKMMDMRRAKCISVVQHNPDKQQFLKGWLNRCDALADHYLNVHTA